MAKQAMDLRPHLLWVFVTCAVVPACKHPDAGPDLQIVGESVRLRRGDLVPKTAPFLNGARVTLVAAHGETLGIQVLHRGGGPVTLTLPGAKLASYNVLPVKVLHASTEMYGGGRGPGEYPDELTPASPPTTDPAYFTITADQSGEGELVVGTR